MVDFWHFLAFFIGIIATLLFFWAVNKRATSMRAAEYQKKGVEIKQENSVRLMAFLSELKIAYDEESQQGSFDLKQFGVKRALPIVLKYPDVVARHGKQLLKLVGGGNGKDLGNILGDLI